ncbi:hypothetical protein LTR62_006328 [Meristemomyces frigidus]|uniref:C3H1-type domain-containing protein n=1 Tax=Meristemomyces frigidus TaxID=1508187 RepID=A0AAN7YEN0_9PEZI|nr:hypothetical protein LTR62_006328 [Meristemomyces frigidus]
MNGHSASLADYSARLEEFRRSDNEREAMVKEVLLAYEDLRAKYVEKCDDYNNEVESRRMWQGKAGSSERALSEQKRASGSSNFALAVLDGDGAVFQDHLLAQGKDGGAEAAHQLYTILRDDLKTQYPEGNVNDWTIVVHIVLNMQGLGNKLQQCGIISNQNELAAFGRAFSLAQPLFSFIDAGNGKERADHKVRETLRLFMPNRQCKHVYFGPCHDSGYLPVLEPYRLDPSTASRLTLVETQPTAAGFERLGLRTLKIHRVFRSDNLPTRPIASTPVFPPPGLPLRTATNTTAPAFHPTDLQRPSTESASTTETNTNSWAAVGKSGTPINTFDISTTKKKPTTKRIIPLNAHQDRLDITLPEQDLKARQRFADRIRKTGQVCNNHHLGGKCKATFDCIYDHGEPLTPGERLVLKHKARSLFCPKKGNCRDFDCFLGHHCNFGPKCNFTDCRFSHDLDYEPAKQVLEDGTEEWLPAYLAQYR